MLSLKGILKYSITIFIAAWMFVLGIMVGRGNSPITFDTRGFQQKLGEIVGKAGNIKDEKKEISLEFFDVLDQPVAEEKTTSKVSPSEIVPKATNLGIPLAVSVKTSTKKRTFKKKRQASKPPALKNIQAVPAIKTKGKYTIQIASYKDFKDAVTHMVILEKKGINSYREKGEKDGITWYRVRTGSFNSFEEAKKFKEKLNHFKIKAMIIKKG